MKKGIIAGASFGLASASITTLGLMIGLYASTDSKLAVVAGILTIAIADAFSDALGVHVSKESEADCLQSEVWRATISTFIFKFVFANLFLVPVIFLPLKAAVIVSIGWGILIISLLSYFMAKGRKESVIGVIGEHLAITFVVLIATQYVGQLIAKFF
jgi:VIT1/CCC1 family predicted Fe2+/Mn2+ transporter